MWHDKDHILFKVLLNIATVLQMSRLHLSEKFLSSIKTANKQGKYINMWFICFRSMFCEIIQIQIVLSESTLF